MCTTPAVPVVPVRVDSGVDRAGVDHDPVEVRGVDIEQIGT